MEEISICYCRICGSDLLHGEDICPKCGGMQFVERRGLKPVYIMILAAAGLVGIIMLGIVSATAITRMPSHWLPPMATEKRNMPLPPGLRRYIDKQKPHPMPGSLPGSKSGLRL